MLKKMFKILGGFLLLVLVGLGAFYLKAYYSTTARMNTVYDITPQSIELSTDSAELEYGARLLFAKGCRDCHGTDLGGKVFIDDPALGKVYAANLTAGEGGLPANYATADWVRALKHGIGRDGKPLLIMPSHEFTLLTERDMAAVISYARQIPRVDRVFPDHQLRPLTYILTELGKLPLLPAEEINHDRLLVKEIKAEVSVAYGKYLSTACQGCHRENMQGGEPIAPGFPVVANITASGNPGKWTEEQFIATLRTGKTPEGKELKPEEMPWNMTKVYTDVELKALYRYLHSL